MNLHKEEHNIAKQSITEALFLLMNEKPLSEITVTELVKKSGIARATYYRNYQSKEEIIKNFVNEAIMTFYQTYPVTRVEELFTTEHISHVFDFFARYRPFLIVLYNANLAATLLNYTNDLMSRFSTSELSSREKLLIYAYNGAVYNVLFNWIISDMKESPEAIASHIMEIFASQNT